MLPLQLHIAAFFVGLGLRSASVVSFCGCRALQCVSSTSFSAPTSHLHREAEKGPIERAPVRINFVLPSRMF